MADITILNTTADISGKTLVTAEGDRTVTGLLTFNRGPASAPFAVVSGAGKVTYLDADKFEGLEGTAYSRTPNVITTTSTGTQNDFVPGTLQNGINLLRCNNASLLTITGIAGGTDGMVLVVASVGAGQVSLAYQSTGSTATNRLVNFVTSMNTPLAAASGVAIFVYEVTSQRWRMVSHDQGAVITPTFSAGDFTASGSMTWTVEAGDVTTFAYLVQGRQMTLYVYIDGTAVGGTVDKDLRMALPGTPTIAKSTSNLAQVFDNSTEGLGVLWANAASTVVYANKSPYGNWTLSASGCRVRGQISFMID